MHDDLRTNFRKCLFSKKNVDNFVNSLNIVNVAKYITINIKVSLFTSSHEIITKYIMLYNYTT